MYRPQNLVAALFSAALLCTTGIALADKGGHHGDKNSSKTQTTAPGQSGGGSTSRGPAGIGKPQTSPGDFDRSMMHGRKDDGSGGTEFEGTETGLSGGATAAVTIKLGNGSSHTFPLSAAAAAALKAHQGHGNLIFFTTNGQEITAVSSPGEKDEMRVVARSGNTFTLQDKDGQTRLITLDKHTANRLHVKVGSDVDVTATSATSGRIVAVDLEKKHVFDKFARAPKSDVDVDVAKRDVDRADNDIDVAKAKKAKKADIDVVKADIDAVKTDIDVPKAKKSKKLDIDVAKLDNDEHKLDIDVAKPKKADVDVDVDVAKADVDIDHAKADIDVAKAKKAKKTDVDVVKADIDQVKSDIDTGKGKKSKKLDIDVAKLDVDKQKMDVDVAMGACGHASSRQGNPAFANQMDKDAANDASGHNPPGLPHECLNPAGHTRGFCKSSSSAAMCGSGGTGLGGENEASVAVTRSKCGPGSSRNGNPAFANQMDKDAANDASGHNPPGLPHECLNPAGHTRGFCKSSSSAAMCGSGGGIGGESATVAANMSKPCAPGTSSRSRSNPAFANQMAKDEANDVSGHNPPGLPHECVNPAGHTRGFCKGGGAETAASCGSSGTGGSAISPSELHGGIARSATPVNTGNSSGVISPGTGVNRAAVVTPGRSFTPATVGNRSGVIAPSGGPTGTAVGAPTHVLGAAAAPGRRHRARHVAMVPTRVLPVAITPVGKRRCVWYKTGVLAASTGGYRIVGTSARSGKPKLHKKCR